MKKKRIARQIVLLFLIGSLSACATLPTDFERFPSSAYTDTQNTFLGREVAQEAKDHPGLSGFYLLPDGVDAFTARDLLANRAERSIDTQYYLYHNDLIGKLFTWQLVANSFSGTVWKRDRRSFIPTNPKSASGVGSGWGL